MPDDAAPPDDPDPALTAGNGRFRVDEAAPGVVHVEGELDADNGRQLERLIDQAFASGPEVVVVDLAGLEFIDSVGLSVLVTGHNRGAASGVGFQVHNLPDGCRRVFEITNLLDVLDLR